VKTRFYRDRETDEPHIYRHGVTEGEVEEVLSRPMEDRVGREGARVASGRTRGGRYLRVIYVPESEADSVFVVTAYEIGPKARRALLKRRRKKP
jgi:hypothetical protein